MTLTIQRRWWFGAAFAALTLLCALTALVWFPAAERLSEWGCTQLARHGLKYEPTFRSVDRWTGRAILLILIAAGSLALLASCSTPTVTRTQTVEVKVPVATQPIRPDQVPAPPAPLGPRPQSLSAATDTLLSKWCEAVAYIVEADPLLRISAGEKAAAPAKYPECGER